MKNKSNCIVVFNPQKDKVLFCKRRKDPYQGLFNFVGGKVEPDESSEEAAYRELEEETGITWRDIHLFRLMDIHYYHLVFTLELFAGVLREDVILKEEKNPLFWLPLSEDFTDPSRFAGDQNIAHIINVALQYPFPQSTVMEEGVYIGVDGCKEGWIAVILDYGKLKINRYKDITALVEDYPSFDAFLIDMVIGLRDNSRQMRPEADARRELGSRFSTVFPVPCRQAVYAMDEEEQKQINKDVLGKSMAKQSVAIIPKIRELDEFFKDHPNYKNRILESHPEVCFSRLKGSPIVTRKKEYSGMAERINILSDYVSDISLSDIMDRAKELRCNTDDVIDALCLAVTAALKVHNLSETIPEEPKIDKCGLYMMMTVPKKRL